MVLKDASAIGVDVPSKNGYSCSCSYYQTTASDHSYLYGEYLKIRPRAGINRPAGSLGRSNACNYALVIK